MLAEAFQRLPEALDRPGLAAEKPQPAYGGPQSASEEPGGDIRMDVQTDVRTNGRTDEWTYGRSRDVHEEGISFLEDSLPIYAFPRGSSRKTEENIQCTITYQFRETY